METFQYYPGKYPVILSIPHAGTFVPEPILKRFSPQAKQLPDTDWHVPELYAFARKAGLHVLIATHSRYVIDLNRDPSGTSLYPGRFTTGLCPTTLFDGNRVYIDDLDISTKEMNERIELYWQPYHHQLQNIIDTLQGHGKIILLDAHSIRSQVPTLFEGVLPDLNLGTADGKSAEPALTEKLKSLCDQSFFTSVCNGRFKGGYITRHYGHPAKNRHAIQLEIAQHTYMQEAFPFEYDFDKAKKLQIFLQHFVSLLIEAVTQQFTSMSIV